MTKLYWVRVDTSNPSADVSGYFTSKAEAKKAIDDFMQRVKENTDYYGEVKHCVSSVQEITTNILD